MQYKNITANQEAKPQEKGIFAWCVSHSMLFHYITILIIIFGMIAVLDLRKEARPNVNFNRITITASYPGATTSDVEQLVLKLMEEKIDEVDGILEYKSTAFTGMGTISVKLDPDYIDKDQVIDEIRRAIDQIEDFPDLVDDPIIREVKAQNIPILQIAVAGGDSYLKMRQEVEVIKDNIRKISGVSKVTLEGYYDLQLAINTNIKKLDENLITIKQISNAVKDTNIEVPVGEVLSNNKEYLLRVNEKLKSQEKLANLTLRVNDNGNLLKVKDIADVTLEAKNDSLKKIYNTKEAIILTVVKKLDANTIDTVDLVKSYIAQNLEQYEAKNLEINYLFDDSERIRSKLNIVNNNILIGIIMVILILFLTLNFRISLVTVFGLIVAFFGGIIVLWLGNLTINTLTILGMIIVLGMLVDDAIVIAENIYFYIEKGVKPREAAIYGVKAVYSPVITAVFTTVIAFFPLIFMQGIIGQFLMVIPIVVTAMLLSSLIEALFILPAHAAAIVKTARKPKKDFFHKINKLYQSYLYWGIRHKKYIFIFAFLYLCMTIFIARSQINFVLFPRDGIEAANITMEGKENSSLEYTESIAKEINAAILDVAAQDIKGINSTIGEAVIDFVGRTKKKGPNYAFLELQFVDNKAFHNREQQVIKDIKKVVYELGEKFQVKDINLEIVRTGPPVGREIELLIYSRDFSETEEVAQKVQSALGEIQGVLSIRSDLDALTDQYQIVFNQKQMNELGITIKDVSQTISYIFGDAPISSLRKENDEIDIILKLADFEKNIANLSKIKVLTKYNQYVPLSAFIDIVTIKGQNSIYRKNGKKAITIYANVDSNIITSKEANDQVRPYIAAIKQEFPNVVIELGGEEKERIASLKNVAKLYIIALIGIFMIISLNLNSILLPIIIISVIPFGITGVVWALFLHNSPVSMMGIIGTVGMSGVSVNGAIILIKTILAKIKPTEKQNIIAIVVKSAVRRLRPILLTTVTTLVGLIPTIYGFGGQDSLIQPMTLVLGWGLFFATIFILLVLPIILIMIFKKLSLKQG